MQHHEEMEEKEFVKRMSKALQGCKIEIKIKFNAKRNVMSKNNTEYKECELFVFTFWNS